MDKETLSQYGWIVIVVIVLALMLALAPILGGMIKNGVQDVVTDFDAIADDAMNGVEVPTGA